MLELRRIDQDVQGPIPRLRIRFWGVQGSCPTYPGPDEVEEYARRVAVRTVSRAFEDLEQRATSGILYLSELILPGSRSEAAIEYQKKLGLPEIRVFGGETSCIEVETSAGDLIVFDAGTGLRHCSLGLIARRPEASGRMIHLFGSHEHLDHRMGLPFARFCYENPPFTIRIYGSHQFLMALDLRYGIFTHSLGPQSFEDDPIDYRIMSARFEAVEIRNPKDPYFDPGDRERPWPVVDVSAPIRIGESVIRPFDAYHGDTRSIAYRLEHGGASFVYCTDHELRREDGASSERHRRSLAAEERLLHHLASADLAYLDGQFLLDEYLGKKGIGTSPAVRRLDWGHSCVEDALERAARTGCRHVLVGHHDPERSWPDKVELDRWLRARSEKEAFHAELAKSDRMADL
jgi:ribonuclease BN (tRNA processing enzyme)